MKTNTVKVCVIEFKDGADHEFYILGVASDEENANRMIDQYYGTYKILDKKEYEEGPVRLTMRVEWPSFNGRDFIIDSITVHERYINEI